MLRIFQNEETKVPTEAGFAIAPTPVDAQVKERHNPATTVFADRQRSKQKPVLDVGNQSMCILTKHF